jgi:hypothetical protein
LFSNVNVAAGDLNKQFQWRGVGGPLLKIRLLPARPVSLLDTARTRH